MRVICIPPRFGEQRPIREANLPRDGSRRALRFRRKVLSQGPRAKLADSTGSARRIAQVLGRGEHESRFRSLKRRGEVGLIRRALGIEG